MRAFKNVIVVVEVSFDHHRFQRNLACFFDKKQAKKFLKTFGNKLPVLEYDEKKAVKQENSTKRGMAHIWLQKMKVPNIKCVTKKKPKKAKLKNSN